MDALPSTLPKLNATQEKIVTLLAQNFPAVVVASSVGCDESYISQLLAQDWFAEIVQQRKFAQLQKQTGIDDTYDDMEMQLQAKLRKAIPMLIKPQDITRTLAVVNAAKRRGAQGDPNATVKQTVVNLTIPMQLFQRFVSNANNQIVEVLDGTGKQSTLVTATTGMLEGMSREASAAAAIEHSSSGSSGDAEDFAVQTIEPGQLELSAEIAAAQEGLGKSLPRTQAITADDL